MALFIAKHMLVHAWACVTAATVAVSASAADDGPSTEAACEPGQYVIPVELHDVLGEVSLGYVDVGSNASVFHDLHKWNN